MSRTYSRTARGLSLALVCLISSLQPAFASPADEIKVLVEQGRHEEAYRMGQRARGETGRPVFDFYFGVAAINAGKASDGVLALERYLLNFPDNLVARLELARGYYLLGDDGRARDEFEAVLAGKPAADISRVVGEYLEALRARESRHKTNFGFSIELGAGNDSNVQSGVSDPNITLPIFGDITLTDSAVQRRDGFANLVLGARVSAPARRNMSVFAVGGVDLKEYREADIYNQNTFSASTGLNATSGKSVYRMTLGRTTQSLDNARYRDTWAAGADWGYQLHDKGVLTLGTQAAKFAYAGANAVRDADYVAFQAGYRHLFSGTWRTEFDVGLSAAREENNSSGHQDLSRDLLGGRFNVNVSPLPSWTFGAGVSYLKSNYLAEDPLLMVTRRDDFTTYELSATYAINPAWSMRGEYMDSRNRSNLPLYAYKRRVGQLKIRFDFR